MKIPKIKLGATGTYPLGKLNASDEGALRFAIFVDDGKVYIYFGTPVAWFALPPDQAEEMGNLLIKKAKISKVKGRN
jgi:hypothetical protein